MNIKRLFFSFVITSLLFCSSASAIAPELTAGQVNIIKRATQLFQVKWTPLQDVFQWDEQGVFESGETVSGVAYGQPISQGGYVGWSINISTFIDATRDANHYFYSGYSTYNKIAPLYSADCSSFVAYAWNASSRFTTASIPSYGYKVSDQSINSMRVGDALNYNPYHVVLVYNTDLDEWGNVTGVAIMELTDPLPKLTNYGSLSSVLTMEDFSEKYFDEGYVLYRCYNVEAVYYKHNCASPVWGDYCPNCLEPAPVSSFSPIYHGKSVTLTSENPNAVIHYTTDGTEPNLSSPVYTEPLNFTSSVTVRAAAYSDDFANQNHITYNIIVKKAEPAAVEVVNGKMVDNTILAGTTIALVSPSEGARVHYTLDGSVATEDSPVYDTPLTITEDTYINTLVVCDGFNNSDNADHSIIIGETHELTISVGVGGESTGRGTHAVLHGADFYFHVTADDGYTIGDVTINGVSTEEHCARAVTCDTVISVNFEADDTLPFTDVSSDIWYHNAAFCVYSEGMFAGISDTLFAPDSTMTGEMFMIVLNRLNENSVELTPDDFQPENNITRQEMAVLLYSYLEANSLTLPSFRQPIEFSDAGEIDPSALEAIEALYSACVISGTNTGSFNANAYATRAEVAQIFANLYYAVSL